MLATLAAAAIFHGTPVPPAETPWLVTLSSRAPFCGGTLVAPDRVLTAAHCVQGAGPDDINVRVGGQLREWRGAYFPTRYRLIPSPVAPESFSASATANDIAVIVLRAPVSDVALAPIAATAPADGETTLTVGHGVTGPQQGPSSVALGATQRVVGSEACGATYGARLLHAALHLCTEDPSGSGAQACAGDSGSPVLVRRDGALGVAGVVTWGGETLGRDCGEGPADVSERVLPHLALVTGAAPAFAPYAERRVRVRRRNGLRRCVIGAWHPRGVRFTVRWFRPTALSERRFIAGHGRTRRVRSGQIGCTVTARTAGGWAEEVSYNAL